MSGHKHWNPSKMQSTIHHVQAQLKNFQSYALNELKKFTAEFKAEFQSAYQAQSTNQPLHKPAQQSSQQWTVHNGKYHCQVHDPHTGVTWNQTFNPATREYFSSTNWSAVDHNGLQSRQMLNHQTGIVWNETYHPQTGHHIAQASVRDQTGTVWHTTTNHTTKQTTSVTDWSAPDHNGRSWRKMHDHNSGNVSYQCHDPHFGTSSDGHNAGGAHNTGSAETAAAQLAKQRQEHCDVLGISVNASLAEANKAYRKKALEWHPDKNLHRQDEATEMFKKIGNAIDFLKKHPGNP